MLSGRVIPNPRPGVLRPVPPGPAPGADCPVDAIARRARSLGPGVKLTVVHEPGFNQVGAQKIIDANPYRLRVVVYAPVNNSGIVWWGDAGLNWIANSIVNGFDIDPGTGWEIDDYLGPIYMLSTVGKGDQGIEWVELTDELAKEGLR